MSRLGPRIDAFIGNPWTKRFAAVSGIIAAAAVFLDLPGKAVQFRETLFPTKKLEVAHLLEISRSARLGDGSSGLSKVDHMYWPMAFSVLNPTSEVMTIETLSVRMPTAMVDQSDSRLWIDSLQENRRSIDLAPTLDALEQILSNPPANNFEQTEALPVTISAGEKLYIYEEMIFDLPDGFGWNSCGNPHACNMLLTRALGSTELEPGKWRCPRGPFEFSVKTRDHGTSVDTASPIILIPGCSLMLPKQ